MWKDELARIEGVGAVRLFGAGRFTVRIWLDPNKVAGLGFNLPANPQRHREPKSASRRVFRRPAKFGESDFFRLTYLM